MERRTFLRSALLGATTAALRSFPARGATPAAPNFTFRNLYNLWPRMGSKVAFGDVEGC